MIAKSEFSSSFLTTFCKILDKTKGVVSSAKLHTFYIIQKKNRAFKKTLNRTGLKNEPYKSIKKNSTNQINPRTECRFDFNSLFATF